MGHSRKFLRTYFRSMVLLKIHMQNYFVIMQFLLANIKSINLAIVARVWSGL